MFCFVMNKNTVVTVIPYTLSSEAYITQDKASVRYKEAWGHMIASEIGNISQKNFNFLKSRLAPLVSPSIYGEFFKKLEDEIAQIKEDKIIISFAPAAVVYEPNTDKVFVFGRSEVTNALGYKTSSVRTYEIKIRMNLYVPQITHFVSYAGEPRNENVLQQLRKKEAMNQKKKAQEKEEQNDFE